MNQQPQNKKTSLSSQVLILALVIMTAASLIYNFWPAAKNLWPAAKATVASKKYVSLTGIFYSEDNPMAIVDGKIVHEGDVIGDTKILKIQKDKVEFEEAGRTWHQGMPAAEEGIASGLPLLLELGSHGCPPCRKMMPILDELRSRYDGKFQIRYIDVWKNRDEGAKYGVRAIPTQIFYDADGNELYRHTGFFPKKDILDTWKKLGFKF